MKGVVRARQVEHTSEYSDVHRESCNVHNCHVQKFACDLASATLTSSRRPIRPTVDDGPVATAGKLECR